MDVLDFFELCSVGDVASVKQVLENRLVDVNFQHKVNGWTALHWASCRGHKNVVELLVKHGADSALVDRRGRSPADVTTDQSIADLLGGPRQLNPDGSLTSSHLRDLPIIPNYLRNPVFPYAKKSAITFQPPATLASDHADNTNRRSSASSTLVYSGICALGVVVLALLVRRHLNRRPAKRRLPSSLA